MNFSTFFVKKDESSECLYYTLEGGTKADSKIHNVILNKGLSDNLLDLGLSRLRARTGLPLDQAKKLLGVV